MILWAFAAPWTLIIDINLVFCDFSRSHEILYFWSLDQVTIPCTKVRDTAFVPLDSKFHLCEPSGVTAGSVQPFQRLLTLAGFAGRLELSETEDQIEDELCEEGALKGSNVPTPRVLSVPRPACWLILAQCTFCSQLYSGKLRVICILICRRRYRVTLGP